MPKFVLKRARDADEFLVWSTVVDSPITSVFSRLGMYRWLNETGEYDPTERTPERRIGRTDDRGTSAIDGRYGWGHQTFVVHNQPEAPLLLTRDEVFEFAHDLCEARLPAGVGVKLDGDYHDQEDDDG